MDEWAADLSGTPVIVGEYEFCQSSGGVGAPEGDGDMNPIDILRITVSSSGCGRLQVHSKTKVVENLVVEKHGGTIM